VSEVPCGVTGGGPRRGRTQRVDDDLAGGVRSDEGWDDIEEAFATWGYSA
jgi:hypothetical protein